MLLTCGAVALMPDLSKLRDVDPVLAAALERAVGMNRERGLRRASDILDALNGPGHEAAVRDAVRDVQAVWPGAMLWEVRPMPENALLDFQGED